MLMLTSPSESNVLATALTAGTTAEQVFVDEIIASAATKNLDPVRLRSALLAMIAPYGIRPAKDRSSLLERELRSVTLENEMLRESLNRAREQLMAATTVRPPEI
jgi:hypothetical protein